MVYVYMSIYIYGVCISILLVYIHYIQHVYSLLVLSQLWIFSNTYILSLSILLVQNLVDACKSQGVTCGVYSSSSQWSSIFGSTSYSYGSNLPLW